MSPFWYAHQIKDPILLMHGEVDDNTGTFPIQSERLYAALKGHGATVRYVTLPNEAHGYAARETLLHVHRRAAELVRQVREERGGEDDDGTEELEMVSRPSTGRLANERASEPNGVHRLWRREMKKLLAAFVVVVFITPLGAQQPLAKKPITHDVYDGWKSIQGTKVSRDGAWVAYALTPQDGDGELVVRNLKTGVEYRAARGRNPVITPDGTFVVFEKSPLKADVDKARKAKRRPEDMPKSGIGVVDLSTGKTATLAEHVKSFRVPEDPIGIVVYLAAPEPAPRARGQERQEGEEGQEGKPPAKKHEPGTDLTIHDLVAGIDQTVAEVMEYAVAKDGSAIAYAVSSKTPANDGAFLRKLADGSTRTLLTGQGNYKGLAFDAKATQLAFVSDRDDYAAKASRFKLYHASISANSAAELRVPAETRAGPIAVSENGRLEFSKDGARLFFGTAAPPHADPDDPPEPVKVDIWHYKDPEIQPMQKVRADEERKQSFRAMITLADGKFSQLASPDMPEVLTNDSGTLALGVSNVPYKQLISWDGSYDDEYLISLADGSRKRILEKANFPASMSPGSNYVLFFDEHNDNWHAIRTSDGQNINLTGKLGVKFQSETDDHPAHPSPYGSAGWTDGDKSVLLYDRYDIWEVKPDGSGGRKVTDGRREHIIFRYQRTEQAPPATEEEGGPGRRGTDDPAVSTTRPLILSAVNEATRASGLYQVTLSSAAPATKLVMLEKSVGVPIKARDADVYVFTLSRFEEFPNLWVSDATFTDMKKISDANPQQAHYNWGKSELIEYVNADGKTLQRDADQAGELRSVEEVSADGLHLRGAVATACTATRAPNVGTSINITALRQQRLHRARSPTSSTRSGYPGQSAMKCVLPAMQTRGRDGLHRSEAHRHPGALAGAAIRSPT